MNCLPITWNIFNGAAALMAVGHIPQAGQQPQTAWCGDNTDHGLESKNPGKSRPDGEDKPNANEKEVIDELKDQHSKL